MIPCILKLCDRGEKPPNPGTEGANFKKLNEGFILQDEVKKRGLTEVSYQLF